MTDRATSLPGALVERATNNPRQVASRSFAGGYWQELGWAATLAQVAHVADRMQHLGVTSGSVVALMVRSCREWPIALWAAHGLGAVTVSVAVDADSATLTAIDSTRSCALWVIDGEEQFDRCHDAGIGAHQMLVVQSRGLDIDGDDTTESWPHTPPEGLDAMIQAYREMAASIDVDQPAAVVPTRLTADGGEVVVMTHRQLLDNALERNVVRLAAGDEYLSFLPPAWPIEQNAVTIDPLLSGAVVNFGARTGGVLADLRAVQPTVLQAPAEFWQSLVADVQTRVAQPAKLTSGSLAKLRARTVAKKLGLQRVRAATTIGLLDDADITFLAALGVTVTPSDKDQTP